MSSTIANTPIAKGVAKGAKTAAKAGMKFLRKTSYLLFALVASVLLSACTGDIGNVALQGQVVISPSPATMTTTVSSVVTVTSDVTMTMDVTMSTGMTMTVPPTEPPPITAPAPTVRTLALDANPGVVMRNGILDSAIGLPTPVAAAQSPGIYNAAQYEANPGLDMMQASIAYDRGYLGQGVTVGFISEYGLNPEHDVLKNNLLPGLSIFISEHGFVVTHTVVSEQSFLGEQGTGLAGVIAAGITATIFPMGVAPLAKLIPLQIHDSSGRGEDDLRIRNAYGRGREGISVALSAALARGAQVVFSPWLPFTIPAASLRINYAKTSAEISSTVFISGTTYVTNPIVAPDTITDGPPQNGILFDSLHVPVMSEVLVSGYYAAAHGPAYYDELISNTGDMLRGRDAVVVVPSGDGSFNSLNGTIVVSLHGDIDKLSVRAANFAARGAFLDSDGTLLSITDANQPGIMAEAPLYNRDLLGKWMVVTAIDDNRVIARFANGCGNAMYWCLAAPGVGIPAIHSEYRAAIPSHGSAFAAAQASGALAVLRSRFPTMPMSAVAAILLRTADDLGAPGVDRVYGHGALNLGAAITVQGDVDLVIGINSVTVRHLFEPLSTLDIGGGGHVLLSNNLAVSVSGLPAAAAIQSAPAYNTVQYAANRGLGYIGASAAYDRGYFGQSATIAYITELGMNTDHAAINPNISGSGTLFYTDPYGIILHGPLVYDVSDGIGTDLALALVGITSTATSTVTTAVRPMGVAPRATLLPMQISVGGGREADLVKNALDAASRTAQVILLPWETFTIPAASVRLTHLQSAGGSGQTYTPDNDLPAIPELLVHGYESRNNGIGARSADYYRGYVANLGNLLRERDAVAVVPAGEGGWNSESGVFTASRVGGGGKLTLGAADVSRSIGFLLADGSTLSLRSGNQSGILAEAPLFNRDLLGKWVVAVGTSDNGRIRSGSNGCGAAMYWCLSAQGNYIDQGAAQTQSTHQAAVLVGGALALLRSRFPSVPMQVMAALLFKTADDLGDPGVDEVYGHGRLNLAAALTVQGDMNLVFGLGDINVRRLVASEITIAVVDPPDVIPPLNTVALSDSPRIVLSNNILVSALGLPAPLPAILNPGTYNSEQYLLNPGLDAMQASVAYDRGYFGQGVTVGFISEYGLNPERDVLQNNLLPGLSISVSADGTVFIGPTVSELSFSGAHGTGLAGLIAAGITVTNFPMGVAPLARIIPIQIHDSGGRGAADLRIRHAYGTGRDAFGAAFGAAMSRGADIVFTPWLPFTMPAASVRISYAKTSTDILSTVIIGGDFLVTSSVSTAVTVYELVIPSPTLTLTSTVASDEFPTFCGGLPCDWFVTKTLSTRVGYRLTSGFPLTSSIVPPTVNISTITDGPPQDGRLHNGVVPVIAEALESGYANGIHTPAYYESLIFNMGTMLRNRDAVVVVPSGDGGFNSANGTVVMYLDSDLGALSVSAGSFADRGGFLNADGTLLSFTDGNQPGIMAEAPLYNRDLLGKWMVVTAIDDNRVITRSANGCGNALYWCLAALGAGAPLIHQTLRAALPSYGTDLAAAQASGALAVLRSRFPAMPMQAVAAILLRTADDLGAPGVDRVYGHGALNLGAAITAQGDMDLVTGTGSVTVRSLLFGRGTLSPPLRLVMSNNIAVSVSGLPAAAPAVPNAATYDSVQYAANAGLAAMQASVAYDRGYFGQGVTVGFISEYGLNPARDVLQNNLLPGLSISVSADGAVVSGTVLSEQSFYGFHGTGLAGLIAAGITATALPMGVAPLAKLIPLQIHDSGGAGELRIREAYGRGRDAVSVAFGVALERGAQVVLSPWLPFTVPAASLRINYAKTSTDILSTLIIGGDFLVTSTATVAGGGSLLTSGFTSTVAPPTVNTATITDGAPQDGRLSDSVNVPVMSELLVSGYSTGDHSPAYYAALISNVGDQLRGRDAVVVVPSGDGAFNSVNGTVVVSLDGDLGVLSVSADNFVSRGAFLGAGGAGGAGGTLFSITTDANQPGIMAEAPLYDSDLLGKWLVVTAIDRNRVIGSFANGCGSALYWCLAAPGDGIPTLHETLGVAPLDYGTDLAAAQASGALAVLRSRFPTLPMQAVAAILLRTADDLGAPGVDRVYGHGALNLGAAIAVQGDMDLVIGINSVTVRQLDSTVTTTTPVAPSVTVTTSIAVTTTNTLSTMVISGAPSVVLSNRVVISAVGLPPAAPAVPNAGTYDAAQYRANPGLAAMQASVAYDRGYFGHGVTVGYISEYGLNPAHDVLAENVLPGLSISVSADGIVATGTVLSEQSFFGSQGTGLAGLIAAGITTTSLPMGVAPLAKIIPLQIHDSGGRGVADLRIRHAYGTGRDAVSVAFSVALARGAQVVLSPWLPFTIPAASVRINYAKTSTEIASTVFVRGTLFLTSTVTTTVVAHTAAVAITADGPPQNGQLYNGVVPVMAELLEAGYANGIHSPGYYASLIADVGGHLRGRDAVVVVPSGDSSFNSINGSVVVSMYDDIDVLSVRAENFAVRGGFWDANNTFYTLTTDGNQPGIMAEAPLYNADLLGKWLVVTAIDNNRVIGRFANGCGSALYWCLAALGEGVPNIHGEYNYAIPGHGTALAAAQASGALAVLRSRFPTMPMPAVAAILLRTADDLGAPGVDRVYGHGALNLGAAITAQGNMDLMIGISNISVRQLAALSVTITTGQVVTGTPPTPTTTTPTTTTPTTTTPTTAPVSLSTLTFGSNSRVVLSNSVAVSAFNLPAPAAVQSAPIYSARQYEDNPGHVFIRASIAYERGYYGQGVTLAYIGNGVNPINYRVSANFVSGASIGVDANGVIVTGTAYQASNRGEESTGVAGLMVAVISNSFVPMGVAPQAKLIPLNIHNGVTQVRNAITGAISVAVERDARIILAPWRSLAIPGNMVATRDEFSPGSTLALATLVPVMPELLNRGFEVDDYTADYFKGFISNLDVLRDKDTIMVVPAGDGAWNSKNGDLEQSSADGFASNISASDFLRHGGFFTNDEGDYIVPSTANQPGILAEAPLLNSNLMGKWMVVVATDEDGDIKSTSNGCGAAMYWCLAVRDGVHIAAFNSIEARRGSEGTLLSAAQAAGALAVLRSRFPGMPMQAVAAILFKTADDLGDKGVDEVYGHGRLNLGAAITVQGDVNLAFGDQLVVTNSAGMSATTAQPVVNTNVVLSNGIVVTALNLPAPAAVQNPLTYNTIQYGDNPGISSMRASVAYDRGYFGQGATIAYIGNGLNPANPRLTANLLPGVSVGVDSSGAIVTGTVITNDASDGDTTGVAGLMAGTGDALTSTVRFIPVGVAPQAKLIPLKIHDGTTQRRNAVTAAFSIAVARGADVVLLPWRAFNVPAVSTRIYSTARDQTINLDRELPVMADLLVQGYTSGFHTADYYRQFISDISDIVRNRDVIAVVPSGDGQWSSTGGRYQVQGVGFSSLTDSRAFTTDYRIVSDDGTRFTVPRVNQPGILAEAPLFSRELLGKWLVVVAANENGVTRNYSNGCGSAMYWCLAVRMRDIIVTDTAGTSRLWNRSGTLYSAAHVAGALAVLRGRFPTMPMSALSALLFKTAEDRGDAGVDVVYGHGVLNLGAAITMQGNVNLVVGLNDIVAHTLTVGTTITHPVAPSSSVVLSNGVAVSASNLPAPAAVQSSPAYSTTQYGANQGFGFMRASVAYERGYFGQSVTIAYIGSGVFPGNVRASTNLLPGMSVGVQNDGGIAVGTVQVHKDESSSGVAALMVGVVSNGFVPGGVAPQAKLIPLLIHDGTDQVRNAVTGAISVAAESDAKVILAPWDALAIPSGMVPIRYEFSPGVSLELSSGDFPVMPELLAQGLAIGDYTAGYFTGFLSNLDVLRGKDAVVVVPAGDSGWNNENGSMTTTARGGGGSTTPFGATAFIDNFGVFINDGGDYITPTTDANQPGILAEAPLFNGNLLGKWMVVVATDDTGKIRQYSNGCGAAMYWCLAMRDQVRISGTDGISRIDNHPSTLLSAAQASGALAVLSSRFPTMPMAAVAAILFKTADDLGATGVDRVYGHGRLNLGAAITVQGNVDLVVGINNVTVRELVPAPTVVLSNGVAVSALNLPAAAAASPNAPFNQGQAALNSALGLMGALVAYGSGYYGQGVTVAYVTHLWFNNFHPVITSNLVTSGVRLFHNSNSGAIVTLDVSRDDAGDGTGLAAAIVAVTAAAGSSLAAHPMGVAPLAKLYPIQVESTARTSDAVIAGISLALQEETQIIFLPWEPYVRNTLYTSFNGGASDLDNYNADRAWPVMADVLINRISSPSGHHNLTYYDNYISTLGVMMRGKDVVAVMGTGEGGWNSVNGTITGTHQTSGAKLSIAAANVSTRLRVWRSADNTYVTLAGGDQPGIMAEAPLFNSDLLGKWMVVAGIQADGTIQSHSNGCGAAMYWCLSADSQYVTHSKAIPGVAATQQMGSQLRENSSQAAALAAGALAVMKSRFPTMPMAAVAAILFKTATDLGTTGVDSVYGHGRLNLGAAITVQGNVDLVVGLNSVTVQTLTAASTGEEKSPAQSTGAGTGASTGVDAGTADVGNTGTAATGLRLAGLSGTHLGAGFGRVRARLHKLPMAVSYLGGAFYYENALSDITEFHGEDLASLGNAAADMFGASRRIRTAQGFSAVSDERSGRLVRAGMVGDNWRVGYDICTECDEESWRMEGADDQGDSAIGAIDAMGSAFFGANEQGAGAAWSPAMISPALDGVEFFSAVGLGEDAEESTYQQYGLRWRGDVSELSALSAFSGFSLLAEWSHIEEGDSLLGSHGDVLGVDSASSRQARLEVQGALPGALSNWRIHGGYTQGWSDADLNGMGLITEMSNLRYAHWHVESRARNLLQGSDELRIGLSGAPRITGDVHFRHYRAGEEVFVEDLQYALPNTVREERFTMHELSDNALIWRLGYKWRVTERHGVMDAALGWEAISGSGANAGDHAASFQLRWGF